MGEYSVAVIGASGYAGSELVRILNDHPRVRISGVTSRSHAGKMLSSIHPHLAGTHDQRLVLMEDIDLASLDAVFLALPHGTSMKVVAELQDMRCSIIDLSGDFRLSGPESYSRWYRMEHTCPALLDTAVYGLPELFREDIAGGTAGVIANPGCYPTASILATAPLLAHDLVDPSSIVVDAKSGLTGAGVTASRITHYPRANEDIKAYGIGTHRHTPEMEEILSTLTKAPVTVQFTPHLAPFNRGILSTVYARAREDTTQEMVDKAYRSFYRDEPFVRVRDEPVSVSSVRGSNYADVFAYHDPRTERVIMCGSIDNLVKGASGQAVQNLNIVLGMEETLGLERAPIAP